MNDALKKIREAENARTLKSFDEIGEIVDGVARWTTNDSVVPRDVARLLRDNGYAVDLDATDAARDAEIAELARRARNHRVTDEEMFEMRAAFGAGTRVVNVLTGRVYQL